VRTDVAPPAIPRRLLERVVPAGAPRDGLLGDLHEFYLERRRLRGRWSADLWYWREACSAALRYSLAAIKRDGATDRRPTAFAGTPWGRLVSVWMQLLAELRPAVRRLCRRPGFTIAAVLPLAAGLGATATIFSLVHDVVLGPLPYPESDRIVVIRHLLPGFQGDGDVPEVGAFLGQLLHYQKRSRLLTDIGGYWTFDGTVMAEGGAEYLHLGGATAGLLRALGVRPVEGRLFRGPAERGRALPSSATASGKTGTADPLRSAGRSRRRAGATRSSGCSRRISRWHRAARPSGTRSRTSSRAITRSGPCRHWWADSRPAPPWRPSSASSPRSPPSFPSGIRTAPTSGTPSRGDA
jgi:hypothetical protein